MMVTVDEVLNEVGGYRRYSLLIYCILVPTTLMGLAFQGLNIVFVGQH